ncbi:hypothetical protein PoB_005686500 [Plakobranchus ocellatus]|uniref:Uncharacterized protein n=1 Tax=Plakobranchus ocellatus TaxID=259542 RepID=A0AAV4CFW1_9GAST|nr:hypothetical protein PoB_005686500 [Plakobranchus ocellatus]
MSLKILATILTVPGQQRRRPNTYTPLRPQRRTPNNSGVRKDSEDLEELVSFDVSPPSHSEARRDLSDMQDTIDLCNERNASFSWHETRLKKAD